MKKLLIVLCILLLAVAAGCQEQIFDGSRTGNHTQFILDYKVLNNTMTHEMELQQGAIIDVTIENQSGRIDIQVTGADGKELYRGDDASSGSFSIEVQEAGAYIFSVTGSNAKGSVSFIAKNDPTPI